MKHGFIKVAAATPKITVADPTSNISEIIALHKEAEALGVSLTVFPELCLTGATAGDLFFTRTLLRAAEGAVSDFADATEDIDTLFLL